MYLGRTNPSASDPAWSRPARLRFAPPRTDPPIVCPCFGFERFLYFCKKKNLPWVYRNEKATVHWSADRSVERSSSRRQNKGQLQVFSSIGLHAISFVRASEKLFKTIVVETPEGQKDPLYPRRTEPPASRPASSSSDRRSALHRPDPTRPWYVRVSDSAS